MDLDDAFVEALWLPLKVARIQLVNEHKLLMSDNAAVLDRCIDEGKLAGYGYAEAARLLHRAIDIYGHDTVRNFLARKINLV